MTEKPTFTAKRSRVDSSITAALMNVSFEPYGTPDPRPEPTNTPPFGSAERVTIGRPRPTVQRFTGPAAITAVLMNTSPRRPGE